MGFGGGERGGGGARLTARTLLELLQRALKGEEGAVAVRLANGPQRLEVGPRVLDAALARDERADVLRLRTGGEEGAGVQQAPSRLPAPPLLTCPIMILHMSMYLSGRSAPASPSELRPSKASKKYEKAVR